MKKSPETSTGIPSSTLLRTPQNAMERCSVWIQEHQSVDEYSQDCQKIDNDPLSEQESHSFAPYSDLGSLPDSEHDANFSVVESTVSRKHKRLRGNEDEMSVDDGGSESTYVSQVKKRKTQCTPFIHQEDTEVETSVMSEESTQIGRRRKEIRLQNLVWDLHCGWKDCDFSTAELAAFFSHVSCHLPHLEIRTNESDEEVYGCLWDSCDFETPNSDEISRHVNFHSYHTKMKCLGRVICDELKLPKCNFGVDGANLVPDLPNVLLCDWEECSLTSNNSNKFYSHVNSHVLTAPESKSSGKFQCRWRGCKAEFRRRDKLEEHLRSHTKEKVVACPTCGSLYASRTKLIDHRKRQIPLEQNKYQCSHCSHYYPTERLLRDHMRHHVNNFKCHFCDMTCPSPWALTLHIRYRHLNERPFACQYCDHRSVTQSDMKTHLRSHMANAPYTCEEEDCKFSCRTLITLHHHYRRVHGDDGPPEYCCHMCDSHYRSGSFLTKHLIDKHNFRWPSGHVRFRYKHHEDGLFRLQTVRYESLEIAEDIDKGHGDQASFPLSNNKFKIFIKPPESNDVAANVVVMPGESDEDVDDPDKPGKVEDEFVDCTFKGRPSMPSLEADAQHPVTKKVLVSIDEVDTSGNVVCSEMVEADEMDADADVDVEGGHVIVDGDCYT